MDFVSVGWWPVFNVADSAIVCGAILLVALTVFGIEPDGSRANSGDAAKSADAADPENTQDTESGTDRKEKRQ